MRSGLDLRRRLDVAQRQERQKGRRSARSAQSASDREQEQKQHLEQQQKGPKRRKKDNIDPIVFLAQERSRQRYSETRCQAHLRSLEPLRLFIETKSLQQELKSTIPSFERLKRIPLVLDWLDDLKAPDLATVLQWLDASLISLDNDGQVRASALIMDACLPRYVYDCSQETKSKGNNKRPKISLAHVPHPGSTVCMFQRLNRVMGMPLATHMNAQSHIGAISNKDAYIRLALKGFFPIPSAQRKWESVTEDLSAKTTSLPKEIRRWLLCCLLGHNGVASQYDMPRLHSRIRLFKLFGDVGTFGVSSLQQQRALMKGLAVVCQKTFVFPIRESLLLVVDQCPAMKRHMLNYVDYTAFVKNTQAATSVMRRRFRQELLSDGLLSSSDILDTKAIRSFGTRLELDIRHFHQANLNAGNKGCWKFSFLALVHKMTGKIPPRTDLTGHPVVMDMNRRTNENKKTKTKKKQQEEDEKEPEPSEEEMARAVAPPHEVVVCATTQTGASFEHCRILKRLMEQFDATRCSDDDMLTRTVCDWPRFLVAYEDGCKSAVSRKGIVALLKMRIDWYSFTYTKDQKQDQLLRFSLQYPYTYAVLQTVADLWTRYCSVQRHCLDYNVAHFQCQAIAERYNCSIDNLPNLATRLWICPTCLVVWSPVRDDKQSGCKCAFGLNGAVIDGGTDQAWCYWAKRFKHASCRETPISALQGLGFEYDICNRRYLICPQKECGQWAVYDPAFCKQTERGPACSGCTVAMAIDEIKRARDTHPLGPSFDFSCFLCGSGKATGRPENSFIYGRSTMLCSRHHNASMKRWISKELDSRGIDLSKQSLLDLDVTKICRQLIIDYRALHLGKSSVGGTGQKVDWKYEQQQKSKNNYILKQMKARNANRKQRR